MAATPEKVAVVEGDRVITYRKLNEVSGRIADDLSCRGIGRGTVVPVLAHRSIELVVALLAVVKTGAAYAPVDLRDPVNRLRRVVRQCGSSTILTTDAGPVEFGGVRTISLGDLFGDDLIADNALDRLDADHPVYVIFTSGTTGTPKGVVIEHYSLQELLAWHNRKFGVGPDSITTLISSVGFDVLQWEMWSSLTAGATMHIVPETVRTDPGALLEFIAGRAVTHAYVPSVLVPDVVAAERQLKSALRYLFCAGEKLSPVATDHLPYTLVDYYGPTEATIFATYRAVEPGSEKRPPSIGTPVAGVEAFILDENLQEVGGDRVGELCLAGRSLARGYLGDPDLTSERFPWSIRLRRRLYRTGDMARWLPDGTIQFLARKDDQVKIRGFRIELGDVETALLENRLVKHAIVLVDDEQQLPGSKRLVAWIVPREEHAAPADLIASLRAHLRHELPDYMLPSIYRCVAELPSTANGKVDRTALRSLLAEERTRPIDAEEFGGEYEQVIAEAWRSALGHSRFGACDDFFEVGGHSLLITGLIEQIGRRVEGRVYVWDFYGNRTVRGLADVLRDRRGQQPSNFEGEPLRELQADIRLPDGVDFSTGYRTSQLTEPRHILLTGATGFFGVHLLERLLVTTQARIHCPIRSTDPALASERLRQVVDRYELEIDEAGWERIEAYPADLAEPCLGMDPTVYATLVETVDAIFHSASAVNFNQPYSYMRRDNVEGLWQLIRFASHDHVKPLMLISSISVYSWGHLFTGKTKMYEADDIDQNLAAVTTDLGYIRSKWVMEKVAGLAQEHGLPVMKFRLGYATCDSRTGHSANYQWWARLVKTCIALGAVPDLHNLREGLTTVDYLADAVCAVSRQPDALGKNFNVVSPEGAVVTLREFFALLSNYFGYEFETIPFRQWVQKWEKDDHAPLFPLLSMFKNQIFQGKSTIELYQDTYLWDCSNLHHHLKGTGIYEPRFTEAVLSRYLRRVLADPYIPEEPAARIAT
ncbi:amino acid adenylation domain-containing protein [Nocardia sp. NPDC004568]|uniref:amino acid adenylation domain-containing protein n=1 Tax=Nocardia sp. NPDC004568 TaxID=3154551 RepID=UPI00339ED58C